MSEDFSKKFSLLVSPLLPPLPFTWLILGSFLTSPTVTVTVGKSRVFNLHLDLLTVEADRFAKSLSGKFNESKTKTLDIEDEDPELFGYFVEYLYRDRSVLSRNVQHYSEYVTLARLYAMGERLQARKFQAYALSRFTQSLDSRAFVSDESTCDLLRIACNEITERVNEDPMRAHIFWFGGTKISELQKYDLFRQTLCDIPDLGKQLCLWVQKSQPAKSNMLNELQYQRFVPESEYSLQEKEKTAIG